MKIKIVSTVHVREVWLNEIREFIPGAEFTYVYTDKLMTTYWNEAEQSQYGDFTSVREIVDSDTVDARVFVMSYNQIRKLGITNHLALYDNSDRDGVLDTYLGIPAQLDARAKLNGFKSNFAWLVCHKLSHGREQNLGRDYLSTNGDKTHAFEVQGKLKQLWYADTVTGYSAARGAVVIGIAGAIFIDLALG